MSSSNSLYHQYHSHHRHSRSDGDLNKNKDSTPIQRWYKNKPPQMITINSNYIIRLEQENRDLKKEVDDLKHQIFKMKHGLDKLGDKSHVVISRQPRHRQTRSETLEMKDVHSLITTPSVKSEAPHHFRVPSSLSATSSPKYFRAPAIRNSVVRGNFLKKKVYFQIESPGNPRCVERKLRNFQELHLILDLYFTAKSGNKLDGLMIPDIIQAPPAVLWKSRQISKVKEELHRFLSDCYNIREVRRHQAFRRFVTADKAEWKRYVDSLGC